MLDAFALLVLIVLGTSVLGVILLLGYLPGHIARQRAHSQAEAVSMCGWLGLCTGGLLLPIAFIWAFMTDSKAHPSREQGAA